MSKSLSEKLENRSGLVAGEEVSRILEIHIEAFYRWARAGKIIGAALIARSIGMKQRMKKSYEKRVAIHSAPSFALAHREVHRKRE